MLQLPDALSADDFLDRYWQKTGLFMPQALPADLPHLCADELGWLATLDDVESRIVFSEHNGNTTDYRLEHGPFDEQALAALPPKNWTLLVQDVEKHLPEFRRYFSAVSFIPDWRIDDLMVSFAAPGGSVGPHRDNYDVFLCQGPGRREWRIAPANAKLESVDSVGLSLLEPFADENPHLADRGDVLYLPPGIAHWGVASESSVTYSIGMRAPTASEIDASSDDIFFRDPDLRANEAEPGLISDLAIKRARECFAVDSSRSDAELARAFGSVVTDVKAWLAPEAPDSAEIDQVLSTLTPEIDVHGMARLACCSIEDRNLVFVNGHAQAVSAEQMKFFLRLCKNRKAKVGDDDLFRWLLAHGAFDLPPHEQKDET